MKKNLLKEIILKKEKKISFSVITNFKNGESCFFQNGKVSDKNFSKYESKIKFFFNKRKNGVIGGTNIFITNYFSPTKVIIIGAVHIAQYLVSFIKKFNFEVFIVDPRDHFASKNRFPDTTIINKWPKEAFDILKTDHSCALIVLTHDPKIDDIAIQHALKNNFFYIGALGSKKTHLKRCQRLKKNGFKKNEIEKIFGPIGLKIGGRSSPEIALSIISQLILEINKR